MSNDVTYHIICAKCYGAFWSKKSNILGDELCDLCKRIKELEYEIRHFVYESTPNIQHCKYYQELFKRLLEK